MRQFLAIALNAFMELIRQPVFLLVMTCSAGFTVFLAAVPYFGFGEDPKLVKDSALAVMLVAGLFGAVLSASTSVAHEIRSGTALAVLSKPVGRLTFLLAKYVGLAGALALLTYVNTVASLLASRMAFDAYGETDTVSLAVYVGGLLLAYAVGGFSNFFLRRQFVADAVGAVSVLTTLALGAVVLWVHQERAFGETQQVDWRLLPAAVLILFALWILAGLALACSTRFDLIPTLAICTGIFLLGLMSDYLFGRRAEPVLRGNLKAELRSQDRTDAQKALLRELVEKRDLDGNGRLSPAEERGVTPEERGRLQAAGMGGSWWARVTYTVLPNWQLFWMADALEGKNVIPWGYVGTAMMYMAGYLGAILAAALWLFEDRELS